MNIELDLQKIALFCEEKRDEDFEFRSFLQSMDSRRVDKVAHQLYALISKQIDCTECGNCCIVLKAGLTDKEIAKLAKLENVTVDFYRENYLSNEQDEDVTYLKSQPCRYLVDKKCSIYEHRPKECRDFPNVHKPYFVTRSWGMIDNSSVCPIVFNVFEQMKAEFGFRSRYRRR